MVSDVFNIGSNNDGNNSNDHHHHHHHDELNNNGGGVITMANPTQYPYVILRGRNAGLSVLRHDGIADEQIRSMFFSERCCCSSSSSYHGENDNSDTGGRYSNGNDDDNDESGNPQNEVLLSSPMAAYLTVATTPEETDVDVFAAADDDEGDGDVTTTTGTQSHDPLKIFGHVFATGSQLLFVAADLEQIEYDVAIGSACIILHAMTDEPELAIYLQLTNDGGNDNNNEYGDDDNNNCVNSGPIEVTITPVDGSDCQLLFKTLCKMVSLHPTMDDNDGDYDDGIGMGGYNYDDDNDSNDELIWAPSHAAAGRLAFGDDDDYDDDDDDDGATDEERAAMLERLDNLLVVQPGYDIQDGQFDDPDVDVVDVDGEGDEEDHLVG